MYRRKIDNHVVVRRRMCESLARGGIYSSAVLDAMLKVPRHLFVSEALRYRAYEDTSLPIGFSQTISKPSTVAKMLQSLNLCGDERVLEIGTGSGYQSAVLAEMVAQVVSTERVEHLFKRAQELLLFTLNYRNIITIHTDGFPADGLFDAIVVSAGAHILPEELFSLLADGGTMVIPIGGEREHRITRFMKKNGRIVEDDLGEALFVPLIRGGSAAVQE